jgi:Holliday junction resolvase RusA-like endonuclease
VIEFFIPGDPRPQGRPRTRVLRLGKRHVAQIYNPHNADDWKARCMIVARPFAPRPAFTGPIRFVCNFVIGRPKIHFRKGVVKPDAPNWHTIKPDFDNFAKALVDALTAIRMWSDDSQLCDSRILKTYACCQSGALVRIEQLTTPPPPELCHISEFQKTDRLLM